jgi:catechol 2,3-dioxygenase-like lactoylglutathione lyase family enzyme
MSGTGPVPDFQALGRGRLAAARSAETDEDWDRVFQSDAPFPFAWGPFWKQYVQYQVDDLESEIGFFIDTLGLVASIFCEDQVALTSPGRDFHFSIVPTPEGGQPTPPDSILLSFMIRDLEETVAGLEVAGVRFEEPPAPVAEGDPMSCAACRTPNGIRVELWEFRPPADPTDV